MNTEGNVATDQKFVAMEPLIKEASRGSVLGFVFAMATMIADNQGRATRPKLLRLLQVVKARKQVDLYLAIQTFLTVEQAARWEEWSKQGLPDITPTEWREELDRVLLAVESEKVKERTDDKDRILVGPLREILSLMK